MRLLESIEDPVCRRVADVENGWRAATALDTPGRGIVFSQCWGII
jgi:hypothetical protein